MKEFYVPSTEFENPDEPFLYLTPNVEESLKNPDIFPLHIELKAVLEFRMIQKRPILSLSALSGTPLNIGMYQTNVWCDQVSVRLFSTGWSTFAAYDEPFQDSRTYHLQSNLLTYTHTFEHIADHCNVRSFSDVNLPCGTKPTQDPKQCVTWYCVPKFSSYHQKLTLSWESEFQYQERATSPIVSAITQGDLVCELMHHTAKKQYRSNAYRMQEDTLWITFIAVE